MGDNNGINAHDAKVARKYNTRLMSGQKVS